LLDVGPIPLPLHVVNPYMSDVQRKEKEAAVGACADEVWVWYTDEAMPPFRPTKN